MFTAFSEQGVMWADETHETINPIIFATGYIPNFEYLNDLKVLDPLVIPVKQSDHNIHFVGIPWQTSLASATIRGSGQDAKRAVQALIKKL